MPTDSRLAREIKQNKPFTSKATEAALALMRTADVVRRSVSGIVGRHDLTPQQYNVLRILRGAGEKGLPTLEIAERMIEETPGITRLIDRLESKQLVSRERCLTDRRQVWCRITKSGLALIAALDEPVRSAEEAALRGFTKKDLVLLVELLDQAREGFALSSLNAETTKEAS